MSLIARWLIPGLIRGSAEYYCCTMTSVCRLLIKSKGSYFFYLNALASDNLLRMAQCWFPYLDFVLALLWPALARCCCLFLLGSCWVYQTQFHRGPLELLQSELIVKGLSFLPFFSSQSHSRGRTMLRLHSGETRAVGIAEESWGFTEMSCSDKSSWVQKDYLFEKLLIGKSLDSHVLVKKESICVCSYFFYFLFFNLTWLFGLLH